MVFEIRRRNRDNVEVVLRGNGNWYPEAKTFLTKDATKVGQWFELWLNGQHDRDITAVQQSTGRIIMKNRDEYDKMMARRNNDNGANRNSTSQSAANVGAPSFSVQDVIDLNDALANDPQYRWWQDHQDCFVLPEEFDKVQKYNQVPGRSINHVLSLAYPFEAIIGNPLTADIIFFSNNPLADEQDLKRTFADQQRITDYHWDILKSQVDLFLHPENYLNTPISAHCVDRNFVGLYNYWSRHIYGNTSCFRAANKDEDFINNHVAFVELGGYHSTKFENNGVNQYFNFHRQRTCEIVRMAIEKAQREHRRKMFVLFRSQSMWPQYIPELQQLIDTPNDYTPVFSVNNHQNPAFSLNQLIPYPGHQCDVIGFLNQL